MNTTAHSAILRFQSDSNEVIRIVIPRARVDIPEAEARGIMEAMITGRAIVTGAGRPAAVKSMEVVTTSRTTIR
jgi:hypothetical protein